MNIGYKVLTIMSDTVDPVMEAGAALEKYFNVVPEESEIEEAEAGAVEAVLPALPSEDTMAGEMETDREQWPGHRDARPALFRGQWRRGHGGGGSRQ